MPNIFDILQVLLWGCTYLLIVRFEYCNWNLNSKAIPLNAAILNFGWEANALISYNFHWAHIMWVVLDVLILVYCFHLLSNKRRGLYFIMVIVAFLVLNFLFIKCNMMLLTAFIIDLFMSVLFLIKRKDILKKGRVIIAIFKFLGDLFAGIFYSPHSSMIFAISVLVLVSNSVYLIWCIKEKFTHRRAAYAP